MTLGERIKECRQRAGLSQEKAAELVGVSRQAVTKWESGQAAPSTENLFRLAEVLGVTVDFLLAPEGEAGASTAEQIYALLREGELRREDQARQERQKNRRTALLTAGAYALIYLIGRVLWCWPGRDGSWLNFFIGGMPTGTGSYLYGWLTYSYPLLWWCMAVSAVPALFGKRRFALITLGMFAAGLAAGTLLGPVRGPHLPGHDHYGWAIWLVCFLAGMIGGALWEHWRPRGGTE